MKVHFLRAIALILALTSAAMLLGELNFEIRKQELSRHSEDSAPLVQKNEQRKQNSISAAKKWLDRTVSEAELKNWIDLTDRELGQKIRLVDWKKLKTMLPGGEISKLELQPRTQEELDREINEIQRRVISALSRAAISSDLTRMRAALAAYQQLRILKLFELDPENTEINQTTTIRLIENRSARVLQRLRAVAQEEAPESETKLEDEEEATIKEAGDDRDDVPTVKVDEDLSDSANEGIIKLKEEQTPYFKDLPGHEKRRSNYVEGDPMSDRSFDIVQAVMDRIPKDMIDDSPYALHYENLAAMTEMLKASRANPAHFGYKTADEVKDVTDIDLEVFFKRIIFDEAKWSSIWGGGLSALGAIGAGIADKLASWRISFMWLGVSAMGFEPFFSGMGIYKGMMRMHLLHRFYSYISGIKYVAALNPEESFNPTSATRRFDAAVVFQSDEFKRDVKNAWGMGMKVGFLIRILGHRKVVQYFADKSVSALQGIWANRFATAGYFTKSRSAMMSIEAAVDGLMKSPKTIERFLVQALPEFFIRFLSGTKNKFLSFIPDGTKKLFGYLTWTNVALTGLDFGVTVGAIMSAVYSRLLFASKSLLNTHRSPGTIVQLAYADKGQVASEDFETATRNVFYPLCYHLALWGQSIQVSEVDQEYTSFRQKACLEVALGLEQTSEEKFSRQYPDIYTLYTRSVDPDFLRRYEPKRKYSELVEKAISFPPYYRILWVAGLRSIFNMDFIPTLYWETRRDLLLGVNQEKWEKHEERNLLQSLFSLEINNPRTLANLLNSDRLSYAVDYLALEMYKVEKGVDDEHKRLSLIRPHRAFVSYLKFHRKELMNTERILQEMGKIIDEEEKGSKNEGASWRWIPGGINSMIQYFRWTASQITENAGNAHYRFYIQNQEATEIIEDSVEARAEDETGEKLYSN